jgi:hypothetical protein
MQHYHRSRTGLELLQRGVESFPKLSTFSRITKRCRNGIRQLLGVTNLSAAGQVERRVGDDSIQPCPESLSRIEPVEGLVGAQKTILHCVFRVLVRHDDRARYYVRPSLVQTHETRKTPLVALPGQTYELPFLIRNTCRGGQSLKGCAARLRIGVLN